MTGYVISILGLCATVVFSTLSANRSRRAEDKEKTESLTALVVKVDMILETLKGLKDTSNRNSQDIIELDKRVTILEKWREKE